MAINSQKVAKKQQKLVSNCYRQENPRKYSHTNVIVMDKSLEILLI
jgi:hypothetical protein